MYHHPYGHRRHSLRCPITGHDHYPIGVLIVTIGNKFSCINKPLPVDRCPIRCRWPIGSSLDQFFNRIPICSPLLKLLCPWRVPVRWIPKRVPIQQLLWQQLLRTWIWTWIPWPVPVRRPFFPAIEVKELWPLGSKYQLVHTRSDCTTFGGNSSWRGGHPGGHWTSTSSKFLILFC